VRHRPDVQRHHLPAVAACRRRQRRKPFAAGGMMAKRARLRQQRRIHINRMPDSNIADIKRGLLAGEAR